jgi:hypothetical protein
MGSFGIDAHYYVQRTLPAQDLGEGCFARVLRLLVRSLKVADKTFAFGHEISFRFVRPTNVHSSSHVCGNAARICDN